MSDGGNGKGELPPGWVETTLGRVATFVMGQAPPGSSSNFEGNGTVFVKAGEFGELRPVVREWTTQPLRYASSRDVLVCVVGATAGKLNLGIDCAIGRSVAAIQPLWATTNSFVYLQLLLQVESLRQRSTGTAQGVLSQNELSAIPFRLPPITEQQRIVAKLDDLLARSRRAKEALAAIPALLERYRQSVLAAAFRGDLTADWREKNLESEGSREQFALAREVTLESICEDERTITYGVVKLGAEVLDGVPCLRTSNVRWLRLDVEDVKRIEPALSSQYLRTILRGGEVLVNVRGTLGGVAVGTGQMAGWNMSREVAIVPVDQRRVDSMFLAYWIASEQSQQWLRGMEKGIAYTGINIEDLRTLPVKVPILSEQREIVARITKAFASIDAIAKNVADQLEAITSLDRTVLARAFRGELVPQDPHDEPASVLLERIRAERAATEGSAKKTRRGSRKASP